MSQLSNIQRLDNFRAAYHSLADRVRAALNTHVGDIQRLQNHRTHVIRLLSAAEGNAELFSPAEYSVFCQSISDMLAALDQACHISADPPDSGTLLVAERWWSGKRGRPRLEFDPQFLAYARELRNDTDIARFFGCSARTVRRRAIEYGLTEPAEPVFQQAVGADGAVIRERIGPTTSYPMLSDEELDAEVAAAV